MVEAETESIKMRLMPIRFYYSDFAANRGNFTGAVSYVCNLCGYKTQGGWYTHLADSHGLKSLIDYETKSYSLVDKRRVLTRD